MATSRNPSRPECHQPCRRQPAKEPCPFLGRCEKSNDPDVLEPAPQLGLEPGGPEPALAHRAPGRIHPAAAIFVNPLYQGAGQPGPLRVERGDVLVHDRQDPTAAEYPPRLVANEVSRPQIQMLEDLD